ncbi:MAG: hypothetical protein LUC90_07065, partial [Lachnospiraceae bacterium]|nr:hypothetical protein [Lachnospiraceae bacterium]
INKKALKISDLGLDRIGRIKQERKKAMKVLFLDVDGVLNDYGTTTRTSDHWPFVDDEKVARLRKIIDETGAKIVLSSDWREERDIPCRNISYLELVEKLKAFGLEIFDYTPEYGYRSSRGREIAGWLEGRDDVESFVILDDRRDMHPNMDRLVRTSMLDGLTDGIAEIAVRMLNGESLEGLELDENEMEEEDWW